MHGRTAEQWVSTNEQFLQNGSGPIQVRPAVISGFLDCVRNEMVKFARGCSWFHGPPATSAVAVRLLDRDEGILSGEKNSTEC